MTRFVTPGLLIMSVSFLLISCGTVSRFDREPEQPTRPAERTDRTENRSDATESAMMIEEGIASWYGPNFHGKLTANGEEYDMNGITAAHRTLPFNTVLRVKNMDNGKTVVVRINDRGPYAKDRIIDLSRGAAEEVDMLGSGTAPVQLYLLEGDHTTVADLKVPSYTVQLASYREEYKAFEHSRQIRGSRVEKIETGSGTVYRVYYGVFLDAQEAADKQKELAREGWSGYVKQIEN